MNLLFGLKNSVSRIALGVVLNTVIIGNVALLPANADAIVRYGDTSSVARLKLNKSDDIPSDSGNSDEGAVIVSGASGTTVPETGGETTVPITGGETTVPETGGETTGPETGGEITVPITGGETTGPETGGETTGPETGGETTGPETGGETTGPETGGETTGPETGGETTGPETGGGTTDPGTGGGTTDPETGGGTTDPGTGGGTTDPGTGGGTTDPGTGGGTTDPGTGGGTTDPGTGGGTTDPGTGGGTTDPGTGGGTTVPGTGGGTTVPGTGGCANPTVELSPQSRSYLAGRAAVLTFANQGGGLIANTAIDKVRFMLYESDQTSSGSGFIPFMVTNGASQRYDKMDSQVDISGFNMAAGLATGTKFGAGHKVTVGAFFEYGSGTYNTHTSTSLSNFASAQGNGDSNYKGGGIFGRVDFAGSGLGYVAPLGADKADGLYIEAAVRSGSINTNFDVVSNLSGNKNGGMTYRGAYGSRYLGGHVAGGYVFNFNEKNSLDVYARYLLTRMSGAQVNINNQMIDFANANSSRIQIGGRYGYDYSQQFKPYIGVAYESERDGNIKAKIDAFNLSGSSFLGGTGILEAGVTLYPMVNNRVFSVDINGQGNAGVRKGFGGGLKFKYQF